jgi:hypothetical protein
MSSVADPSRQMSLDDPAEVAGSTVEEMDLDAASEREEVITSTRAKSHGKLWDPAIGLSDDELAMWEVERKYFIPPQRPSLC